LKSIEGTQNVRWICKAQLIHLDALLYPSYRGFWNLATRSGLLHQQYHSHVDGSPWRIGCDPVSQPCDMPHQAHLLHQVQM
jgi:hypothetical protein